MSTASTPSSEARRHHSSPADGAAPSNCGVHAPSVGSPRSAVLTEGVIGRARMPQAAACGRRGRRAPICTSCGTLSVSLRETVFAPPHRLLRSLEASARSGAAPRRGMPPGITARPTRRTLTEPRTVYRRSSSSPAGPRRPPRAAAAAPPQTVCTSRSRFGRKHRRRRRRTS